MFAVFKYYKLYISSDPLNNGIIIVFYIAVWYVVINSNLKIFDKKQQQRSYMWLFYPLKIFVVFVVLFCCSLGAQSLSTTISGRENQEKYFCTESENFTITRLNSSSECNNLIKSNENRYLTATFIKYFFSIFIIFLGLISIFYGWLNQQYRHFNDTYVDLVREFTELKEDSEFKKLAVAKRFIYLLSEERKIFFDYNIFYQKNLVSCAEYILDPYFYILNTCYIFGMNKFVDSWASSFKIINLQSVIEFEKYFKSEHMDGNYYFNKCDEQLFGYIIINKNNIGKLPNLKIYENETDIKNINVKINQLVQEIESQIKLLTKLKEIANTLDISNNELFSKNSKVILNEVNIVMSKFNKFETEVNKINNELNSIEKNEDQKSSSKGIINLLNFPPIKSDFEELKRCLVESKDLTNIIHSEYEYIKEILKRFDINQEEQFLQRRIEDMNTTINKLVEMTEKLNESISKINGLAKSIALDRDESNKAA
ncbi:MAG: hypothetical protein ACK4VO_13165 [Pseudobdellovibrio sp.]